MPIQVSILAILLVCNQDHESFRLLAFKIIKYQQKEFKN